MAVELTGLVLDKLKDLTIEEHAAIVAELCGVIEPAMKQFQGRVAFEMPNDANLNQRADYAQFSPRRLKDAIATSFPDAVAF